SAGLQRQLLGVDKAFRHALAVACQDEVNTAAQRALILSYAAAEQLVQAYMHELLPLRRQQQPRLEAALGCRVSTVLPNEAARALAATVGNINLTFPWGSIEPSEGQYD